MGVKLIRSAYSTILREARDGSAGAARPRRQHRGAGRADPDAARPDRRDLRACLKRHPVETLERGRLPHQQRPVRRRPAPAGRLHLHADLRRRRGGRLRRLVAHHLDLGGGAPGLNIDASDVYQEGLRFPPSKSSIERDWNGGRFERLVTANVRVPDQTIGDFNAQFAANAIGVLRVKQLCARYGAAKVEAAMRSCRTIPSAACARPSPRRPTASSTARTRSTTTASPTSRW